MLNDAEINAILEKLHVPFPGREYIQRIRQSPPSRLIGTQPGKNVCTWYSSTKMGRTIQAESRTGEFAFCMECEFDEEIKEYWDQITPVPVVRHLKNGSVRRGDYTPDYLVISSNNIEVIEIKAEVILQEYIKTRPKDWIKEGNEYIYLPAKNTFKKLGLRYRVISTDVFNQVRISNLKILVNSRNIEICGSTEKKVLELLRKHTWLRLSDLAKKLEITDLSPVLRLIDNKKIFSLLSEELLSQTESVVVSSSEEYLHVYKENYRNNETAKTSDSLPLLYAPPLEYSKKALENLERAESGEKSRHVRRIKAKIKKGKKKGLSPFQSLLPKYINCGNNKPRINPVVEEFISKFIYESYSSVLRLNRQKAFGLYKYAANEIHPEYPAVSRKTFINRLNKADKAKVARGRGGNRASNSEENPSSVKDRELRATMAFELAAIDHYLADIMCVLATSSGVKYTARPWVTVLLDLYTKAILAVWVSYRDPSRRTDAMVIRHCVRNHGMLPASISADRGSDFMSDYFVSLLASRGSSLVARPSGHSRFGSEIERIFGAFKTQWLALRPGNIVEYKEARSVSGSHKPENFAVLTLEDFMRELTGFTEWWNNTIIGNEYEPPIVKMKDSIKAFPFVGKKVVEDHAFIVESAVDVRKFTVDARRGIHIDGIHYWSPQLARIEKGKKPEVRIEPENPYKIYVRVKDEWVTCMSTGLTKFDTLDPIRKLAESVRILDGSVARTIAKEEAEQELIKKVFSIEGSKEVVNEVEEGGLEEEEVLIENNSVFAQVREENLDELVTSTWEA